MSGPHPHPGGFWGHGPNAKCKGGKKETLRKAKCASGEDGQLYLDYTSEGSPERLMQGGANPKDARDFAQPPREYRHERQNKMGVALRLAAS